MSLSRVVCVTKYGAPWFPPLLCLYRVFMCSPFLCRCMYVACCLSKCAVVAACKSLARSFMFVDIAPPTHTHTHTHIHTYKPSPLWIRGELSLFDPRLEFTNSSLFPVFPQLLMCTTPRLSPHLYGDRHGLHAFYDGQETESAPSKGSFQSCEMRCMQFAHDSSPRLGVFW